MNSLAYRTLFPGFVLIISMIAGCGGTEKGNPTVLSDSIVLSNRIRLKDLNGQSINLQNYKGKTIFLNFWATWCKPCIEEMPSIEKVQNILRNDEVIFFLASSESPEEIKAFRAEHNYLLNYAVLENPEELGIQALPTTFIFSRKGHLIFSEQGVRKWDDQKNIELILKSANKDD